MANWAVCVTRLYEHINKKQGHYVMAALRHGKLFPAIVCHFKVLNRFEISMPGNTFKVIKPAECLLQEHLRLITLSDFSLCTGAAQISIFIHSSLETENIYI